MTVGELFINIGIKGADTAGKALSNIGLGLTDVSSKGLAAKAAVIGLLYALERMTSQSAQRGQDLKNFSILTGISVDALQRWQIAANRTGQSAESMTESMAHLQQTMADMDIGKGQPEGWAFLSGIVDVDPGKIKNVEYMMNALRQFAVSAQAKADPARANWVLRSFGLTDDAIITLKTFKGALSDIKKTEFLNNSEIDKLTAINVQWREFWRNLNLFKDQKIAAYGGPFVKALSDAFKLIRDISTGIEGLIKQIPELQTVAVAAGIAIGAALLAFGGPLTALNVAITGIVFLLAEIQKFRDSGGWDSVKERFGQDASSAFDLLQNGPKKALDFLSQDPIGDTQKAFSRLMNPTPALAGAGPTMNQTNHITTHAHGVKDARDTGRHVVDGLNKAQDSSPAKFRVK